MAGTRIGAVRWQTTIIFVSLLGVGAVFATNDAPPAATAANAGGNPASSPGAAGKTVTKPSPALSAKPLWMELTPLQKQALAPLATEWDKLDSAHKKKWLAISSKYASLKPDQQLRLQDRMRDWTKLTPEQRRVARESYARTKKLNPRQKSAEWQHYQQLPEEQKKKLAHEAAAKKRVANLPPPSQGKGKMTPPPKKAAPKSGPVLIERRSTPAAASPTMPLAPPSIPSDRK
jgi:hypothetical protein